MSDITRRDVLRRVALAVAGAGLFERIDAEAVHQMAGMATAAGPYTPVALTTAQFGTLEKLTDLIIPLENGAPGAVEALVPPWIDMLLSVSPELKQRYVDGLAWIDGAMKTRGAADFSSATRDQQAALLDVIAYRRNDTPDVASGIQFFTLVRRMTVDGFYTSPIGMRDIYRGNQPSATFHVPPASLDYALKRSPV